MNITVASGEDFKTVDLNYVCFERDLGGSHCSGAHGFPCPPSLNHLVVRYAERERERLRSQRFTHAPTFWLCQHIKNTTACWQFLGDYVRQKALVGRFESWFIWFFLFPVSCLHKKSPGAGSDQERSLCPSFCVTQRQLKANLWMLRCRRTIWTAAEVLFKWLSTIPRTGCVWRQAGVCTWETCALIYT